MSELIAESLNDITQSLEQLDVNKDNCNVNFDYAKILYYSLVFDNVEYEKVLSCVLDKTKEFGINDIYYLDNAGTIEEKVFGDKNMVFSEDELEKKSLKKINTIQNFTSIISKLNPKDSFIPRYEQKAETKTETQEITDTIVLPEKILYKLNDKFHITMLFLDGKKDERALEFVPFLNKSVKVKVVSIGLSDKFIVCGVELGKIASDEEQEQIQVPYYGNPIQHITIGIKKTDTKFKLFPKDSPSAFEEGCVIRLDEPLDITGTLIVELKQDNSKTKKTKPTPSK